MAEDLSRRKIECTGTEDEFTEGFFLFHGTVKSGITVVFIEERRTGKVVAFLPQQMIFKISGKFRDEEE